MRKGFWDGKGWLASTNYIWQILISGFSELTQHHNLTSKVSCEISVLKKCKCREGHGKGDSYHWLRAYSSKHFGTSLFFSCNFAPHTVVSILGRGTSIYLVAQDQNNQKMEGLKRHFPPWVPSILHSAWCIACVQKQPERMNAIIISLESLNWLIFMTGSHYLLWFCGCFAGWDLCHSVYLSLVPWSLV